MDVSFPEVHAANPDDSFSIVFPIDVDGERIQCVIETEALQDINPGNATDTADNQYLANKYSFQEIAEIKIRNGEVINGKLRITQKDVL